MFKKLKIFFNKLIQCQKLKITSVKNSILFRQFLTKKKKKSPKQFSQINHLFSTNKKSIRTWKTNSISWPLSRVSRSPSTNNCLSETSPQHSRPHNNRHRHPKVELLHSVVCYLKSNVIVAFTGVHNILHRCVSFKSTPTNHPFTLSPK